jgi:hypothetical protein
MLAMAALEERSGRVAPPWEVDFYSIDDRARASRSNRARFVGVVVLLRSGWSADELTEASALMRRFVTI